MNNKELEINALKINALKINAMVRVSSFSNKLGIITKINKKTCLVLVDDIKVEVPHASLVLVNEKKKKKKDVHKIKIKNKKLNKKTPSLDLHGLKRDEAQTKIEYFLSDCLLKDCDSCIIIHGIGTGVIKELTHSLLLNLKNVKNFICDDLNPGQTKVFL